MRREGDREELNKRLKHKIIVAVLALVCILALVLVKKLYIDRPGRTVRNDVEMFGPYKVTRIVDGDTLIIKMDGDETKVRLIGVDTPESVAPENSGKENSKEGSEATDYLTKLVGGKTVYLEFDVGRTDQYGRLLSYVYLSDKETMVQRLLLSEGYAMVMTYQPNVKYADEFLKLQQQAREDGKGFWGSGYYE